MSQSEGAGRPAAVTDDELIAELSSVVDPETGPVATAGDVADGLPIKRDGTLKRLRDLAEDGEIGTMKPGSGRVFWPLPDGSERQTQLAEHEEGPAPEPDREPEPEPEETVVEEVRREVENVDVPGSGQKAEERREAIVETVRYARDHDHVTRSAYEKHVFEEFGGEYKSGYSAWKNCVQPALSALAERVDRLEKPDTSGEWRVEE